MEIRRTDEFDTWLRKLRDMDALARIGIRLRRIQLAGNLGDHKAIGGGLYELRVDHGPGYRIYFTQHGSKIVLLLVGGDKSSQRRDIRKARELARRYVSDGENNAGGEQGESGR